MPHKNEPSLKELKQILKDLILAESTDENMAKLKAVESQIARLEKENEQE